MTASLYQSNGASRLGPPFALDPSPLPLGRIIAPASQQHRSSAYNEDRGGVVLRIEHRVRAAVRPAQRGPVERVFQRLGINVEFARRKLERRRARRLRI